MSMYDMCPDATVGYIRKRMIFTELKKKYTSSHNSDTTHIYEKISYSRFYIAKAIAI